MNQVDAELRRFFARRIVRSTVLIAILIAAVSIGIVTVRGHPARSGNFGRATTVTDRSGRPFVANLPTNVRDTRIDVGRSLHSTLEGVAVAMLFVGIVLGASFIGAEFFLGSLTSQLLYEPRRWRLHLAKAVAVAIGTAIVTAIICIGIGALMYGGSVLHGVVRDIDTTWWRHRAVDLSRTVAAASAAAVLAYSFTIFVRRTTATIVLFLAQFPLIGIVRPERPVFGALSRYAPIRGLVAITSDPRAHRGDDMFVSPLRTNGGVIVFLLVWVIVLVTLTGVSFSRSEVR